MKELDLRSGDVVVDIGAGDGWWAERMADVMGREGIVYAAEVKRKLVDKMKEQYAGRPQIRPYLTAKESTQLPNGSCDLAFFSQVYHHLPEKKRVDYLCHLQKVVKGTGRLAIIEKYPTLATRYKTHGTRISSLALQAEQAGWVLVRYQLLPRTYHYLAIFVKRDLFPPEPKPKRKSDRVVVCGISSATLGSICAEHISCASCP